VAKEPDVDKLSPEARRLLELVPVDGDFVGNVTLKSKSGLGEKYWDVRRELVDRSFITLGKGRGGSVARTTASPEPVQVASDTSKYLVEEESDLYEPLKLWLESDWGQSVKDEGDFFDVQVTGTPKGRIRASGQWSRPDLTVVQVNSYELLPQVVLEVSTFEVKRFSDAQNIASVYEAAAHSRWSHYAYLVAEVPESGYEFPERFMSELERFKIGLILMWRDKVGWHFEQEEYETDRLNPDPRELDVLLKYFFQDNKRLKEFRRAIGK
jgi:hypothetical protein